MITCWLVFAAQTPVKDADTQPPAAKRAYILVQWGRQCRMLLARNLHATCKPSITGSKRLAPTRLRTAWDTFFSLVLFTESTGTLCWRDRTFAYLCIGSKQEYTLGHSSKTPNHHLRPKMQGTSKFPLSAGECSGTSPFT